MPFTKGVMGDKGDQARREPAPLPRAAALALQDAVAFHRQGRLHDAARLYESVLEADNHHVGSLYGLGLIWAQEGRIDEAIRLIGSAIAHAPEFAEAHNVLGSLLQNLQRLDEAVVYYENAVVLKPGAEMHNNLGNALQAVNRIEEAIAHYETALAARPDFVEAHCNLGVAFHALKRTAAAIACYERALALKPDDFDAHYNMGLALWAANRLDEARAHYEAALATKPPYAEAYRSFGHLLLELGRIEEATVAFETAVEIAPRRPKYYRDLVDLKRVRAGDRHLTALEDLARDLGSLPADERMELHFALGKAYADLERHEPSFRHLLEGNALKRQRIAYDEPAALRALERTQAVFTPALMQAKQGGGDPSAVPVFILGMWRSGTTLVEQIVASHPNVFGGGESRDFEKAVAAFGEPAAFPDAVQAMTGEQLRQFGARYLEGVTALVPPAQRITGAERITDKMPSNFRFVGLIHLALPNARIVHVRRDPIDTCLSCFSKLFTDEQPYIYNLGELGRYYRAYRSLMEHWRRVLPDGVMLDVSYEEIVDDLVLQARRIIAHCGLPWDESCLAFHTTSRPVRTASAAQVRRPIYRTSVGRPRPHPHLLRPLVEGLGEPF